MVRRRESNRDHRIESAVTAHTQDAQSEDKGNKDALAAQDCTEFSRYEITIECA